jgi:hypothetical protein
MRTLYCLQIPAGGSHALREEGDRYVCGLEPYPADYPVEDGPSCRRCRRSLAALYVVPR